MALRRLLLGLIVTAGAIVATTVVVLGLPELRDEPRMQRTRVQRQEPSPIPVVEAYEPEPRGHGVDQVRALVRDRPAMAFVVASGDTVWEWAVDAFEGGDGGERVVWCGKSWEGGRLVQTLRATATRLARLRLRALPPPQALFGAAAEHWTRMAGEMQWARVVTALARMNRRGAVRRIWREACAGRLTEREYVEQRARVEFAALREVRRFYHERWRPRAGWADTPRVPEFWFLGVPERYEKWLTRFGQLEEVFRAHFVERVVPYRERVRRYRADLR